MAPMKAMANKSALKAKDAKAIKQPEKAQKARKAKGATVTKVVKQPGKAQKATRARSGIATKAVDQRYTAYIDGAVNPLLTDGDYSSDADFRFHRVEMKTGGSIVFDLGVSTSIAAVKIANGHANSGDESTKQWTISSGVSLEGPWTSKGTVSFRSGSCALDGGQADVPTVFSSRFVKMTIDSTWHSKKCALRQMGFIAESTNSRPAKGDQVIVLDTATARKDYSWAIGRKFVISAEDVDGGPGDRLFLLEGIGWIVPFAVEKVEDSGSRRGRQTMGLRGA